MCYTRSTTTTYLMYTYGITVRISFRSINSWYINSRVFSVHQLQEKLREQNIPLYISFIDLTKAFDLASRDGFFKILTMIGCPPYLKSLIESFHNKMWGTVQQDGNISKSFKVFNGVMKGTLCTCTNTLWKNFLFSSQTNHWHRGKVPAYTNRRQTVQPVWF